MEATKPEVQLKSLSASRIKTLENCSWLYWANYHLKLPQHQNDGAKKGDICHRIFELLLNKKHLSKYKKIVKEKTVTAVPSIERIIQIYARQLELLLTPEVMKQLDEMIIVGLKTDFFVKGGTLIAPEFKFDIQNQEPRYNIKGFMDKPYATDKYIIIDDFKSSKKKFEGEDQESNVQAMIYSLAARKIWPDKIPKVRFIFLQFPEDPMMKLAFSDDTLKGFEQYLSSVQKKIDNFSERDAKRDFAADKEATGGEFKGKLLCGFAKSPNTKKKDGTKMWHCPYKFAFEYFIVKKGEEFRYSTFNKEKIILKDGETIETAHYAGCPKFNGSGNVLNNFSTPKVSDVREKTKFVNVLDDF